MINRTDDLDVKIISVLHSNPVSNYDNLWRDLLTLKSEGWKEYLKRIVRAALYFRLKYHMYKTLVQQFDDYTRVDIIYVFCLLTILKRLLGLIDN